MGPTPMRLTLRTVAALTALAVPAALAALPFKLDFYRATEIVPQHVPDGFIVAAVVVENLLAAELGIVVGLLLSARTGLAKSAIWGEKQSASPEPGRLLPTVVQSAAIGFALALAIMATAWLLLVYLRPGPTEELGWMTWKRALAGVSAGVIEELFFRMGVMTAIVWVVVRLTRQTQAGLRAVWTGAVISAVLFAAAHFNFGPALISYLSIGLMCAWLYWRRGLEAAIVGHASFDVAISVLAPAFGVPI